MIGTEQEPQTQLVLGDMPDVVNHHMTQAAHFNLIFATGNSKNKMLRSVGCECIHIEVNEQKFLVYCTQVVQCELLVQFCATRNRILLLSCKTFVCPGREIEYNASGRAGHYTSLIPHWEPHEWTKHAIIHSQVATELYIIDVIGEFH
jgi:hypothetical protein